MINRKSLLMVAGLLLMSVGSGWAVLSSTEIANLNREVATRGRRPTFQSLQNMNRRLQNQLRYYPARRVRRSRGLQRQKQRIVDQINKNKEKINML